MQNSLRQQPHHKPIQGLLVTCFRDINLLLCAGKSSSFRSYGRLNVFRICKQRASARKVEHETGIASARLLMEAGSDSAESLERISTDREDPEKDAIRENARESGIPRLSQIPENQGILKSTQSGEIAHMDSQPPSNLQLPTNIRGKAEMAEGNNTTSRISTLISQNTTKTSRRVSFAPDVTLHSFESVPERKSVFREPRRRISEPMVTSTQNDDIKESIDPDGSLMELTEPVRVGYTKNDRIEVENYTPVFSQEDSMDITQLFSKHSKSVEGEKTMDFTAIHSQSNGSNVNNDTIEFLKRDSNNDQQHHSDMSFTTVNVHQTPKKGNASPVEHWKRQKLNEDNEFSIRKVADTEEGVGLVNSDNTENQDEDEDMELTLNERMSPIKLKTVDSGIIIPSKPKTQVSYSLDEFLDQTGVTFIIDTNLIEQRSTSITFDMTALEKIKKFRINHVYSTLYVQVPILEMNAFICKELLRRISQSKTQFEDLNKQISSSVPPPLLFNEYFNSSEEVKPLMDQQIHLVKSYSKCQAKKLWYEWRIQHLSGIKTVLLENLQTLEESCDKLNEKLLQIQDIKFRAEQLRDSIRREIKLLKELPPDIYKMKANLTDKVKVESLRQELKSSMVAIGDSNSLVNKIHSIEERISEVKVKLVKIKKEMKEMHQNISHKSQHPVYSQYHVSKLRSILEVLGIMSGVQFVKLHKSDLTIKFDALKPPIEVTVRLGATEANLNSLLTIEGYYKTDGVFKYLFNFLIDSSKYVDSKDSLVVIINCIRESIPVIKQYTLLKMLFPVQLVEKDDSRYVSLQIEDCDIKSNNIVQYELLLQDLITAVVDIRSKVFLKAYVRRTQKTSFSNLSARFLRKASKVLPWISQDRCEVVFSET